MKFKHIILMLAAATMAAACNNEERENAANQGEVTFNVSVPVVRADVATRADAVPYTPAAGTLTLFAGSPEAASASATYIYKESAWTTPTPIYWQDLTPATTTPLYTFFASAPASLEGITKGSVPDNQSAAAGPDGITAFEHADLLVAYATAEKNSPLSLALKHVMSQMQVKLATTDGTDAITSPELATATITIDGLPTGYALDYTQPTTDVPVSATAEGSAAKGLVPLAEGTGAQQSWRFIAAPQEVKANTLTLHITLILAGEERHYSYTNPEAVSLEAGAITLFTITVGRTEVKEGSVTLTPWTDATPVDGTATLVVTPAGSGTTSIDPAFAPATFSLWKGKADFTAAGAGTDLTQAPTDAATYTANAGSYTSPTPFYIDDTAPTDAFYALATAAAKVDDATQVPDIVAAGPVLLDGTGIALPFAHVMAQATIELKAALDFTPSLTDAAISLSAVKTTYSLKYADATARNGIVAQAAGTATSANGWKTSEAHLLPPQTIAAGSIEFTVTLSNGNTYRGTNAAAIELKAGMNTVITLTMTPSGITIPAAGITLADWGTTHTGGGELVIAGLTIGGTGATTGTPFNPANGDLLTLSAYKAANATDTPEATALYTYTAGSWSTAVPLRWDDFDTNDAPLRITALLTPGSTPTPVGSLKDILCTATDVDFGAPLTIEMKHIMARLTINLKPGTGYAANPATPTDAETAALLDKFTTRTISLDSYTECTVKRDGTPHITLAGIPESITADKPFTPGTIYLVTPQTMTDKCTVEIVHKDTKQHYTLALNKLSVKPEGSPDPATPFTRMESTMSYVLTLTVNKTGIECTGITLADWGTTHTGGGELVIN